MLRFNEYLKEEAQFQDGGLTIFDIDDTLFHTTAMITVNKDGKPVNKLTNQEFNTYKLKPGESFDYSEFRSAKKFHESKPITRMLEKAKSIIRNVQNNPLSRVVVITARANFDNKNLFLQMFQKHGIDTNTVRIERAGNIDDVEDVAAKKYVIIYNYLNTKQFSRVRLFDDSMANLRTFLKLKTRFPGVSFEAYYAKPDGSVRLVK